MSAPNTDHLHPKHSQRQTVGAILVRGQEGFDDAAAIVGRESFTEHASRTLWDSFARLSESCTAITPYTVYADLGRNNQAAEIGSALHLVDLADAAGAGVSLEYHARIVAEAALRRDLIGIGERIASSAASPSGPAEEVTANAYAELFALESGREQGPRAMADVLAETLNDLNDRTKPGYKSELRATGLCELDRAAGGGFAPGELVIVAARPGRGKTAFLLQLARTFTANGERPLLFSLEMRDKENAARVLAAEAQVNSILFRGFEKPDGEKQSRIMNAYHRVRSGPPSWIDDRSDTTPALLASTARRFARKNGTRVVLVDYLQLIRPTNAKEPRHQQVGEAARALKLLARNQQIVVVCAAQLNREIEGRPDPTPRLSDLRDSGEIEQHADFVFFLHGSSDTQHQPEERIELICGKGRSVSAGYKLPLQWNKPRMTFTEQMPQ